MATNAPTDGYSTLDLRRMDREEARNTLTVAEFERWESLHDAMDRADQAREDFQDAAEVATDVVVFADKTDLAADVRLFGNDVAVYYDPEDEAIRNAAERMAEAAGVDPDDIGPDTDPEDIRAEDIDGETVADAKAALADLISASIVTWNGTHFDDLSPTEREAIRTQIMDKWGLAGLMDAWVEIQASVERDRDERLERIRKFRNPERRGDR